MLTTDRSDPSPTRVGSTERNRALSSDRLEAFLQEPARDGNILVMLPDSPSDAKISRKEMRMRMSEKIRDFIQQYGE